MISISDYYRVNIAKADGKSWDGSTKWTHWAWMHLDTFPEQVAKEKVEEIRKRFPRPEYKVDVYLEKHRGQQMDW